MKNKAHPDLLKYLKETLIMEYHPLLIELDEEYRITFFSGNTQHYGLDNDLQGQYIGDLFSVFYSIEDDALSDKVLYLPFIETDLGIVLDVHIITLEGGHKGVIIIDVAGKHYQRVKDQQKSNELILLRDKLQKTVNELQLATLKLERQNEQLEESVLAKSHFIANMAHEFRTPLTSILGYSRLLREPDEDSTTVNNHIDTIERGVQNLMMMIENLLDQASIEAGEAQINHVPTNLRALFDDIYDIMRPLAMRKNLQFDFSVDQLLTDQVYTDPIRLRQIIINLTGNAIKFTDEGSVKVEASWQEDVLNVWIRDTGPGISEEDQLVIFNPFKRIQKDSRITGTGLGLSISTFLVERLDGILSADSKLGVGSIFHFNIPAVLVSEEDTEKAETTPRTTPTALLIVEDDVDILDLFTLQLQSQGYQVYTANNGVEAVEMTDTVDIDLVLLDQNMPVMSGDEACRIMRDRGFNKPIISLTASVFDERDETSGFTDYLTKPVDIDQIINKIESHITT